MIDVRIGDRSGKLVVIEPPFSERRNGIMERFVKCVCDCGNEKVVYVKHFYHKKVKSCGCIYGKKTDIFKEKHGLSRHPLYNVWRNVMRRCYSEECRGYRWYGARGIKVHDRWHDVSVFIKDVEGLGYRKGLEIDRIDSNKDYEPGNIRFVTKEIQLRNTSKNVFITHKGKTQVLSEWARETNISIATLSWRIRKKWSIDRLFVIPLKRGKNHAVRS